MNVGAQILFLRLDVTSNTFAAAITIQGDIYIYTSIYRERERDREVSKRRKVGWFGHTKLPATMNEKKKHVAVKPRTNEKKRNQALYVPSSAASHFFLFRFLSL